MTPVQNLVVRLDIAVDGVVGDVGPLTTRSPVTEATAAPW